MTNRITTIGEKDTWSWPAMFCVIYYFFFLCVLFFFVSFLSMFYALLLKFLGFDNVCLFLGVVIPILVRFLAFV